MKLIRNLDDLPAEFRACAVSIGNFDGVHRGHARIVERLVSRARRIGGRSVAFTFDPHPVRILRPHAAPPPLTWTDRKAQLLAELGVECVVAYPTDEALLALSPEEFFDEIVRRQLDARAVVEGPNFYFGHDRAGDIARLKSLCRKSRIALDVVEPLVVDEQIVSSSRIRSLIAEGDVEQARRMLTQPYRIRGMVTHGAARGAKLGFPTANIEAVDTLLPAAGVYAGRAYLDQSALAAAINIGPNPTFGDTALKVEAHLIDFEGSLYGRPLEVDFLARLRDIQPFASPEVLIDQLHADVARCREFFASAVSSPTEN
jgi:riboflavin kinase/FMN adenylyltransferase